MEVVNFCNRFFREIPEQDNPAYGRDECLLLTKSYNARTSFSLMRITPVDDPFKEDSVIGICEFYDLETALKLSRHMADAMPREREKWES